MSNPLFDYNDGDLIFKLSDQTALDTEGHLMMRMGDNMVMDMYSGELHFTSQWDTEDDG